MKIRTFSYAGRNLEVRAVPDAARTYWAVSVYEGDRPVVSGAIGISAETDWLAKMGGHDWIGSVEAVMFWMQKDVESGNLPLLPPT
jgi:hypothetical protein